MFEKFSILQKSQVKPRCKIREVKGRGTGKSQNFQIFRKNYFFQKWSKTFPKGPKRCAACAKRGSGGCFAWNHSLVIPLVRVESLVGDSTRISSRGIIRG